MQVDIPFKVELFKTYQEFEECCPHILDGYDVYRLLKNILNTYGDKLDANFADILYEEYRRIARLEGEWTVVGTSMGFNVACFLLVKPGRIVATVPCMFCEVIGLDKPIE